MIEVEGISKRYGAHVALARLDLTLDTGDVVAFVGKNGAGKTTALRIVVGYLEPDRGRVRVDGQSMLLDRARCQRNVGYAPEGAPVYLDMRVSEYLEFRAGLKGLSRGDAREAAARVAVEVDLEDRLSWLCHALSRGMLQRVALADALLTDPSFLILDEPLAGLDPEQQARLSALLMGMRGDRAMIIATHSLLWVESLATRFVFLDRGMVVASGELPLLRAKFGLPPETTATELFDSVLSGAAAC